MSFEVVQRLINESTIEVDSEDLCENPAVSVLISAYEHREFIEQCVESVLEQKTNFPFEIIIGDDGSKDGTYEVLQAYQKKYPEKIRLFRSEPNLGQHTGSGRLNGIRNMIAARGEFVALLEGDDFWNFSGKLQSQMNFLESNPQCDFCFHNVNMLDDESGETHLLNKKPLEKFIDIEKMSSGYIAQTASYFFRNIFDLYEESWFSRIDAADNAFRYFFACKDEHVGYIDESWATWRRRSGTATEQVLSNRSKHCRGQVEILMRLEDRFERDLSKEIDFLMWVSVRQRLFDSEIRLDWRGVLRLINTQLSIRFDNRIGRLKEKE